MTSLPGDIGTIGFPRHDFVQSGSFLADAIDEDYFTIERVEPGAWGSPGTPAR